jgi:acyl-CoA thioesterase FadM
VSLEKPPRSVLSLRERLFASPDTKKLADTIDAGIRVAKLGTSSVRYEVGLFAQGEELTAARGHFVHVYVDRETRRPVPLPGPLKAFLETLT